MIFIDSSSYDNRDDVDLLEVEDFRQAIQLSRDATQLVGLEEYAMQVRNAARKLKAEHGIDLMAMIGKVG
jgi:hypothetical protein